MHFVIVIYTACKSLAKWWGLFLGTSHFELEGWQNNPPVGFFRGGAVADRGVSGPWGPQFCGVLCNGETQRLPAGGAGSPQVGSEARPRRQTHFGNNIIY